MTILLHYKNCRKKILLKIRLKVLVKTSIVPMKVKCRHNHMSICFIYRTKGLLYPSYRRIVLPFSVTGSKYKRVENPYD